MSQQNTAIVQADEDYVAPFPLQTQSLAQGEVGPAARLAANLLGDSDNHQATAMAMSAMATVELQMRMAMSFPRRPDDIHGLVAVSCANPEFADVALYSFPKGGTTVSGPSVKLAEEMARHWGHVNSGFFVVMDSEDQRTIRAWAWDLQTNYRRDSDITFAKKVQRRRNGQTVWETPDEKDLQMLTMAKAAVGVRNMLLALMPDQLKRDAVSWCRQTLQKKDATDPEAFKKKMIATFARLGVTPGTIADLIGKDIGSLRSPADDATVEYLRGIRNRLDRGEANLHDIIAERAEQLGVKGPAPQSSSELRKLVNDMAHPKDKPRNQTTEV